MTKPWRNFPETFRELSDKAISRPVAPPPKLTLSQWSDEYRRLSSEASAEPGRWYTDRAPYQRGIMDALSDPTVETVVCMKSAQVGWTEILLNCIGYYIHQDASPILCVQPTLEMGQAFSKDRMAPMLRDTPALQGLVAEAKSKSGDNTLLHKRFAGGHLTIAGANSAAGLASRPIRVALFDEVDRYPPSAGSEGDPVSLGVKRTRTFWNRKVMMGSTPTVEGLSRVDNEYRKSDQRRYYVPCPHCGHKTPLDFADFDWKDAGTLDEPVWLCRECGGYATDQDKPTMLRDGEWLATAAFDGIAGFHINEFYSPWSTWSEIFKTYERVKGNREQLKTWVNTTLGECWNDEGEDVDPEGLSERAELYQAEAPSGVQLITCGIDVQQDRWECYIWGWSESGESWLIDSHILHGDPTVWEEWARLDQWLLTRQYEHQTGSTLPIVATGIDAGYLSDMVYRYCAQRYGKRVYALKGVQGEGRASVAVMAKPKVPGPKPPRMFAVGVDGLKAHFYAALQTEDSGPNYVHFPTGLDAEFYAQLTAERRRIKYVRGFKRYMWEKVRKRNEALDCRIYAAAALAILNPVWERINKPKKETPEPVQQTPAKQIQRMHKAKTNGQKRRAGFVNRWK